MSEPGRTLELLQKHRSEGLLIDTNLLLLLLVGTIDRGLITVFKRTGTYDEDAFNLLIVLVEKAGHVVVTPHVATEVSNLGRQLSGHHRRRLSEELARFLVQTKERAPALSALANTELYARLGVADAGIAWFRRRAPVVLTDDLDLSIALEQAGRAVINFSHLRGLL